MTNYEEKQKQLLKEKKWVDDTISKGGYCLLCGYNENPLILEEHHIGGKSNSRTSVVACANCHKALTLKQRSWDKSWTRRNNSPIKKTAFVLRGSADVLAIISNTLRKLSDMLLKVS